MMVFEVGHCGTLLCTWCMRNIEQHPGCRALRGLNKRYHEVNIRRSIVRVVPRHRLCIRVSAGRKMHYCISCHLVTLNHIKQRIEKTACYCSQEPAIKHAADSDAEKPRSLKMQMKFGTGACFRDFSLRFPQVPFMLSHCTHSICMSVFACA